MKRFSSILRIIFFIGYLSWLIKSNQNLEAYSQIPLTHDNEQTLCHFVTEGDQIEVIAFKDGRRIYTLFTVHLLDEPIYVQRLLYSNAESMETVVSQLNNLIEQNRGRIQSEQSDVQQILDLVNREPIDWVGIEASPDELREYSIDDLADNYHTDRD